METAARTHVLTSTRSNTLLQLLWIAGFAIATAVGARIEIPYQPVPFTLQTFTVLLAGAFLGSRNGAASQILYLAAGVAGLPVFAGGAFGFAKLMGPTGGYLLAFPAAAAVVGYLVRRHATLLWRVVSMACGLCIIFLFGTLQLYAAYLHDAGKAIALGLLIFSWWDLLKLGAAATIYHEVSKRWARVPTE
jgi:biotin transport system substrate-specific component